MQYYLLLTSLVALLATASPLVERAGGPIAKPIPAKCTVIDPLPHASCGVANVNGWMPESNFVKQNLIYQAYYEGLGSEADQAKVCKQQ